MIFYMRKIFAFLLATTAFCFAQSAPEAVSSTYNDSLKAEQLAKDIQIDYDGHYLNLIHQEDEYIDRNVTLSILSGSLIAFGSGMTALFLCGGIDFDGQESLGETLEMEALIFSATLTAIGVVGLSYNLYDLYNSEGHYNKRDSYKRAHEIYMRRRKEQKSSAKLIVAPTFSIAHSSAGMNLLLMF